MSKLAQSLAQVDPEEVRVRRGPRGDCDIYGDGDLDDCAAVERLRLAITWAKAQLVVDEKLGVKSIPESKFRYHWSRKCWHWTEDQKRAALDLTP